MDELEELRRRKLAELQARSRAAPAQGPDAAAQAEAQAAAEEAALERLLQQILEPEARERLTRVRMSRPDVAAELARQLVQLAQQGRLARRITDTELRSLLAQAPQDRDIKITRK